MSTGAIAAWVCAFAGVLLCAECPRARADGPIGVDVPTGCGSEREFRRELAGLVETSSTRPRPRVSIAGPQRDGRYRLTVRHPAGTRVLHDRDCRALFRSAILITATAMLDARRITPVLSEPPADPRARDGFEDVPLPIQAQPEPEHAAVPMKVAVPAAVPVAVAVPAAVPAADIDAESVAARSRATAARTVAPALAPVLEPSPGPVPQPVPEPALEPASESLPVPEPDRTPWTGSLGLGGGAQLGLAPAAAPMIELAASLERGSFGVVLGLRYLFRTQAQAQLGRGVAVDAIGGWIAALVQPLPYLRLQAGMAVDRLEGEGRGPLPTRTDQAWSLGPRLELTLVPLRVQRVRLELGVAGQWSLLRPGFEIVGFGPVYNVPQLSGGGIVRLSWAFP